MADIAVSLVADDQIAKEAEKASKAMQRLAEQEKRVAAIAHKLGHTDLKAVSKAVAIVDREERSAAAKAQKEAQKLAAAKDKALKATGVTGKAEDLLARKREDNARKAIDFTDKLIKGEVASAASLGVTAFAAVAIGAAFAGAVAGAVALTGKIVQMAAAAGAAKQSALAMFSILEGGAAQGAKSLALVDAAAVRMGVPIEQARERFIKFRQAGADNKVSASLLKLTADLDAIDPSGKVAEQAIEKVLAKKKADGTLDLVAAKEEMALLAKQAGVAGDGATATAARFGTLGGAMRSLDNSKTEALEKIWERIGPTVDRVAGAVAKAVDEFINSEEGAAAIEKIGAAVDIAGMAIEKVVPHIGGFIGAIATAIGIGTELAAAIFLLPEALSGLGSAFSDLAEQALSWGAAIIDGVIEGLDPSRLLAKVGNVAQGVISKFAGALGIASPSKAFRLMGEQSGEGYEGGLEDAAPDADRIANALVPDAAIPVAGPAGPAGAPAPAAGGSAVTNHYTITVQADGPGAEAIGRSVRREIESLEAARALSLGEAA